MNSGSHIGWVLGFWAALALGLLAISLIQPAHATDGGFDRVTEATIAAGGALTPVDTMNDPNLFGPWFTGDSWNAWRAVLKGAFGLRGQMSAEEIVTFHNLAQRDPPSRRVREFWIVAGRRSGKDSVASEIGAHSAALACVQQKLRPGERAMVACLACDRDQAKIVLDYMRGYFQSVPLLNEMVMRQTKTGMQLDNGVDIVVATNSFRAVRGRPVLIAILDEVAFYHDENSTTPDVEVYRAIRPALATLDGMVIGISTGHRKSGLLYSKFQKHFGQDGDDVLVIKAPSLALNPTIDPAIIEQALADDPEAARSEWLGEFRDDISGLIDSSAVEAVTIPGRLELVPVAGIGPFGFCDPSGGRLDSFTAAVAHRSADGKGILDAVIEIRPPFSPDAACQTVADFLRRWGLHSVTSDSYAAEWVAERFREHGITVVKSERTRSQIYLELVPLINAGRVELLDHTRMLTQLCSLERRLARSGREFVDAPRGGHEDLINAAAGALVNVAGKMSPAQIWARLGAD